MDSKITPTVMKLGGSVITIKDKVLRANNEAIIRLAKEIKQADVKSLIVIHGGGSFGHPFAKEYAITEGYKNPQQLIGFSKTHQAMITLNKLVVDSLIQCDVPAVDVQPSSFIMTKKGRISEFNNSFIFKMLQMNFVPVLYGDAVLDVEQGFSILSGDQLLASFAISLGAKRIIVGVDVDGLYTTDPKLHSDAKLIEEISLMKLKIFLKEIGKSMSVDVTGGMYGKIAELIPALEKGIDVKIINARKVNRLYKALMSHKVRGTAIRL